MKACAVKTWTNKDLHRLRDLVATGYSSAKIGELLGRTSQSVRNKMAREELTNRRCLINMKEVKNGNVHIATGETL
jgi:IS30 family transposase